jgi:hypothetical protein
MGRLGAGLLLLSLTVGCRSRPTQESLQTATPAPSVALSSASAQAAVFTGDEAVAADASNPLGLPPHKVTLDAGRRVFTFSDRMLKGAKLGSTLIFYAATVTAFDGDDLIVEGNGGSSYRVHAGYVIAVPDQPKVRVGDPVVTEWNGAMKHAVVTRIVKDRTLVRYTDMEARTPEGSLKSARIIKQIDGLAAGNYAALEDAGEYKHVLLVSASGEGVARRWFALGFGGAAMVVPESSLRPIAVKFTPKVGAAVWAEWVGTMRPATVVSLDDPALFTVKFERAGRAVAVGWGLLMKPLHP